jgi:hypothetical protein
MNQKYNQEKQKGTNCIKLKRFYKAKETINSEEIIIEWEKIFANYISNKRIISKMQKKDKQFNNEKIKHPI